MSSTEPQGVTHTYHTTKKGHKVLLDLVNGDRAGPVLISYHGGGIVNGSRRDLYVPGPISNYRLLLPSSGLDIYEDVTALLDFLPSILTPNQLSNIFAAGFSGGGYPARLVAVVAAQEARRPKPRYTVRGVVSFFGMGGDFLLDYWLTPRGTATPLDESKLQETQKKLSDAVEPLRQAEEISDASYHEGDATNQPSRQHIWDYFHALGALPDLISGLNGVSKTLCEAPREKREGLIPEEARIAYPQIYFAEHPKDIPPILLLHGTADQAVPYEESVHTFETLSKGGGDVEFKTIPGGDHNLAVNDVFGKEAMDAYQHALQWMLARSK